jgi:ribosomal protein L11 methyltransferase
MKNHFIFRVKATSTVDQGFLELTPWLSDLYEIDDPTTGTIQIGGYSDEPISQEFEHAILEHVSSVDQEIDWVQQWANYAPDFHHGLAHIDLAEFGGPILKLKPGGGFGDFSHPTTRLVLKLMAPFVRDKTVYDLGCGSGILSIAAVLLGAKQAIGIDIEEEALVHSKENAELNGVGQKTHFAKAIDTFKLGDEPCVMVMNMIETEQQAAWGSAQALHAKSATIVTSGILASQKEHYLKLTASWHWHLIEEQNLEGWLGFVFAQSI